MMRSKFEENDLFVSVIDKLDRRGGGKRSNPIKETAVMGSDLRKI